MTDFVSGRVSWGGGTIVTGVDFSGGVILTDGLVVLVSSNGVDACKGLGDC